MSVITSPSSIVNVEDVGEVNQAWDGLLYVAVIVSLAFETTVGNLKNEFHWKS